MSPTLANLRVVHDTDSNYYLVSLHHEQAANVFRRSPQGRGLREFSFDAGLCVPDLLRDISPELKRRMQGKSCFNFKTSDEKLLAELAKLTKAGFAKFKSAKYI